VNTIPQSWATYYFEYHAQEVEEEIQPGSSYCSYDRNPNCGKCILQAAIYIACMCEECLYYVFALDQHSIFIYTGGGGVFGKAVLCHCYGIYSNALQWQWYTCPIAVPAGHKKKRLHHKKLFGGLYLQMC
jgi:hypothetical protein